MAIQVVRQDEIPQVLKHAGPVGIPLSQPPCLLRTAPRTINERSMSKRASGSASPGKFRRGNRSGRDHAHSLRACSFAPDDGVPIELKAGDTAFSAADNRNLGDQEDGEKSLRAGLNATGLSKTDKKECRMTKLVKARLSR